MAVRRAGTKARSSHAAPARDIFAIARAPGALRLLGLSVAARLPLAMLSIGLLVHTQRLSGSFAAAGLVAAGYALAEGAGAPLLGRLVDRRGQTLVLLASASASAALLVTVALLPAHTSAAALIALAAAVGLATPPAGACMRTLLPDLLGDLDARRAAYALESSALELTFIAGPPLILGLGALWSTGAALVVTGVILAATTIAFALQPASRAWRPPVRASSARRGALRAAGMRTLVLVLVVVGIVFGAAEVGVVAAATAMGGAATAGPLLAVWGIGSLVGGAVAARLGGGARRARGLALLLLALTAGHAALAAASTSAVAMAVILFAAGASIAPTYATVYAMVEAAAPPGSVTEAFTWLSTAVAAGAAVGAAAAGVLAEVGSPAAAFALCGIAGAAAVTTAVTRARSLAGFRPPMNGV